MPKQDKGGSCRLEAFKFCYYHSTNVCSFYFIEYSLSERRKKNCFKSEVADKSLVSKMSDVYDLCIIGAGMFGSAAARHASANPSCKVCLVGPNEPTDEERADREIFSCHYDEGRITRVIDSNPAYEILSKKSIKSYREIEELSGIEFYSPVGLLCIGEKKGTYLEKLKQAASVCDVPLVDLSYSNIFHKRYPYIKLKPDDCAILEDAGAGYISARNLVAAQKKVAKMQGCHIISEVVKEVQELHEKHGLHLTITEGGRKIFSKRILICTGAFTNFKNFMPLPKLKINALKETVAFLEISKLQADIISSMPSIICMRESDPMGSYTLPAIKYPDGKYYLKIGHSEFTKSGSLEALSEITQWYLSKGDQKKVQYLSKALREMLPDVKVESISSMTCVTTETPSGLPYIDRVTPTVTVAVAGNGVGAKLSEEVGRIAATLSLTGRWDSELERSQFKIIKDEN
ncbi:uncharacterized protein LOC129222948 [Uloborus diversus]|uniref:uncharacterized protein LOC129222948 n=1 Tax=Uloborus diversus TaxID=327109 RepID=UPI0024094CD3|nr:uncharacterized protein LOC129222948 [Uloborus diversus]